MTILRGWLGDTRRWAFSSSLLAFVLPQGDSARSRWSSLAAPFHALFSLVLPDQCRVCNLPLQSFSRIPVCGKCLCPPEPFLAEFFCRQCKTPFLNRFPLDELGLCRACRLGAAGFDAAYSYGAYEGGLRTLIHLYKFSGFRPLADPLTDLLHRALPIDGEFDLVTPMPLHWFRRWRRGFNQSELLAVKLGKRRGIPCVRLLERRRPTRSQTSLTPAQRRKNVAGAFLAAPDAAGKRILLVDDVLTTGATANACGSALKRAGAASVTILTIARADRRLLSAARPIEEPEE